jgi:hypothetical protein
MLRFLFAVLFLLNSFLAYPEANPTPGSTPKLKLPDQDLVIADRIKCEKKCGPVPRLIDLPSPDEIGFDSEVAKLVKFNKCIDKCGALKNHVDKRIKELDVQPTISSLQKELNACQSQLAIIQEKEPKVYNKLKRDFKKVDERIKHRVCEDAAGLYVDGEDNCYKSGAVSK